MKYYSLERSTMGMLERISKAEVKNVSLKEE
jgi:hypothetical protein